MRQRGLGQEEHSEDIGLERPLELLLGNVADVLVVMLLSGIIDEDIEPAEFIDGLLHGILAKAFVADVAGNRDRVAAFTLHDLFGLRRVIMFAKVEDGDVRALARE